MIRDNAAADFIPTSAVPPDFRIRPAPPATYRWIGKRCFDIALVVMGLPLTIPVILILAAVVMRDGGNPFFGHPRIGRDGRPFRCWKIRTMRRDAEARLRDLLASDAEVRSEWDASFKLKNDPRVTRVGRFLRRSSLDELPQIWNILKGEMSVVGPRPVTEVELDRYGFHRTTYMALRPGLTGLWQVSGRNDVSYDQRVEMDARYGDSCGFRLDLMIVARTVLAVCGRTGR